MKVRNLEGIRGTVVRNQFIINEGHKTWFQSYNSIIVEIDREYQKITIGCDWDYSRTTAKYLKVFLNQELYWCGDEVEEFKKKLRKVQSSTNNIFAFGGYSVVYDAGLR